MQTIDYDSSLMDSECESQYGQTLQSFNTLEVLMFVQSLILKFITKYKDTSFDRPIWVWAYQGSTPFLYIAEMIDLGLIWFLCMHAYMLSNSTQNYSWFGETPCVSYSSC